MAKTIGPSGGYLKDAELISRYGIRRSIRTLGNCKNVRYSECNGAAMVALLEDAKKLGFNSNFWQQDDPEWDGKVLYQDAVKASRYGLPGLVDGRLSDKVDRLVSKYSELIGAGLENNWHGPIWDMPSVLAGLPEPGLGFAEMPVRDRLIRIMLSGFCSGSIDHESINRRGKAIITLLAAIDALGYPFEAKILSCGMIEGGPHSGQKSVTEIRIHESGQTFDLQRMAFMLGHVAPIRHLLYAFETYVQDGARTWYYDNALEEAIRQATVADGGVALDPMLGHSGDEKWNDDKSAQQWVEAQISRIDKEARANMGG